MSIANHLVVVFGADGGCVCIAGLITVLIPDGGRARDRYPRGVPSRAQLRTRRISRVEVISPTIRPPSSPGQGARSSSRPGRVRGVESWT